MAEAAVRHLKLRAVDEVDLQVIAACLQDALVPISEMVFQNQERRFLAAFTRFRRESVAGAEGEGVLTQCQCALTFDDVLQVRFRGIDRSLGRVRLELLTMLPERAADGHWTIDLLFAGDVAIRLDVDRIEVRLEDFGECWPAPAMPLHAIAAELDS